MKDIDSLLNGKTKSPINTSSCFKFMVLLDTPEIRKATIKYLNTLDKYKEKIVYLDNKTPIDTNNVYVVFVEL